MFMALDPRQAPSEVYGEFPVTAVARGESGQADLDLGAVSSVVLSKIHRFTPEILALVRHIHLRYPALDLGPDWELDIDSVQSEAAHGDKPLLILHPTRAAEAAAVAQRVQDLYGAVRPECRIAIILIDPLQLPTYQKEFEERTKLRLQVIQGPDDVEGLRYSKKSVVLGPAEYLAGLQFDYVVIAAIPNESVSVANLGYQRRRLLTLLYLGVSRATRHVE